MGTSVNHGEDRGTSPPRIRIGDANANVPQVKKYSSEFTKICYFKPKNSFFLGRGLAPSSNSSSCGSHSSPPTWPSGPASGNPEFQADLRLWEWENDEARDREKEKGRSASCVLESGCGAGVAVL